MKQEEVLRKLQGAPPEEIGWEEDEDYEALDGAKYPFNGAWMRLTNADFEEAMSPAEGARFEAWKSERRVVEINVYQHIQVKRYLAAKFSLNPLQYEMLPKHFLLTTVTYSLVYLIIQSSTRIIKHHHQY